MRMKKNNYKNFLLMLIASFLSMYIVMFLNVYSLSHIYLNLMMFYMVLLMVCPMALIMIFFMKEMYQDKKLNRIIIIVSVFIFLTALILFRTQTLISDEQYLKSMITHHSSAILSSKNTKIDDAEIQILSEKIIETQEKEIAQMKNILERLR